MVIKNFVSVVIANLNGEDLLRKNLHKIVVLEKDRKNLISEIIVVDDGSTDGSVKYIKDNFPQIRLIKHKINRGVAAALNTGVRSAKGNLVLMISADMFPSKDLVVKLLPHFDDQKVFAVSFHEKGVGPEMGIWKDGYVDLKNEKETEKTHDVFYVRKGSGMFSREIWIELGGMDEKLFLPFYWDDLDICYRAAKRGYMNLWEPKALVEHQHWGTVGKFPKKFIEETDKLHMLFLIWKNIHSARMFRRHLAGLFIRLVKNPFYLKTVFAALGKLPVILKERRREIRVSRLSDEIIFSRSNRKSS